MLLLKEVIMRLDLHYMSIFNVFFNVLFVTEGSSKNPYIFKAFISVTFQLNIQAKTG